MTATRNTKQRDDEVVPVIVRRDPSAEGGQVFALFPTLDAGRGLCRSFQHVGQHCAADYAGCIARSRPVDPRHSDAVELLAELVAPPYKYKLKPMRRAPRQKMNDGNDT